MDAMFVWNGRVANPEPSKGGAMTGAGFAANQATDGMTRSTSDAQSRSDVDGRDETAPPLNLFGIGGRDLSRTGFSDD